MTKGPRRLVLDQYLDTASEGALTGAGANWTQKATDLDVLGQALRRAAQQAELRIGEQTLTGPAVRASMEQSAASLAIKSEQLNAAGMALTQVGQQIFDAREARDSLADLGPKPPVYQAPAGTPGVEPTKEEIAAQAAASQVRTDERSLWQTRYEKQEARSLALTKDMDAAFLAAIPPMKEIHGQQDPTEPPADDTPSGPSGPYLPGTQASPVTGGGGGDSDSGGRPTYDVAHVGGKDDDKPTNTTTVITNPNPNPTTTTTTTTTTPTTHPTHPHIEGPTTTVTGTSQNGVTYQPGGPQVSTPGSTGAASAAALGAAGGAGGLAAGAIRPGSMTTSSASSAAPVRSIGSTGRSGSPGALSRSAGSSASPAAGRSAGSAAGRGAAAGSTGSSAGRGGAGSRGAGTGSAAGSRSGGRGGRKGERDRTTDRDGLVHDQDWLGDDDVAPGVLD